MARSLDDLQTVALNRFGLGAKRGGRATLGKDPKAALIGELSDPKKALIDDPSLLTTPAALMAHFEEQERLKQERQQNKARAAAAPGMMAGDAGMAGSMEAGKPAETAKKGGQRRDENLIRRTEMMARVRQGFEAQTGFLERLVMFWSNHFCVSVMKGAPLQASAGAFEREAIRPHVLGRFEDMVLAVEKHPAMLIFLDNRQSIGPDSRAGQNRKRGLNENLAREILELHTLGVDGGYTQADVTALANIITGWTVAGAEGRMGLPGSFVFNANAHQPGSHTVLGKAYGEGGVEQGERALRDIAAHPSVARFIARKLARHFIADDPPKALVARLEKVFRETRGDLLAVTRALIESEEAWNAPLTKIRMPAEFLVAAARAVGQMPQDAGQIMGPLGAMGQQMWGPAGPNGFSDAFDMIAAPEAMKTRLELAWAIGRRVGAQTNPFELAEDLFGSAISAETLKAIGRAESKQQGLAILLMAPEFQRR